MKTTVCTLLGLQKGIYSVCPPCGIMAKKKYIKVDWMSFGFKTTEKFELFLLVRNVMNSPFLKIPRT